MVERVQQRAGGIRDTSVVRHPVNPSGAPRRSAG
jgi:hypothetical protein